MGFRTVVVLFNDQASEWENDPSLGKKISRAKNFATGRPLGLGKNDIHKANIGYGRVVECAHADTQTLAVLDSYNMTQIAHSRWNPNDKDVELKLLKEAAEKLGYKIVKA